LYEEQSWYFPKSLMLAEAHALLGSPADAEPEYRKAMDHLEGAVASDPKDSRKRVASATACVGLKRYEEAIAHIKAAADIEPISKDAVTGPLVLSMKAIVHARSGDHATALNIIEHLLSIPSWTSPGYLRVSPNWDGLRHLPQFDRLINLPPRVF
jgi:tetratricopeptide (TPR) repeat protein